MRITAGLAADVAGVVVLVAGAHHRNLLVVGAGLMILGGGLRRRSILAWVFAVATFGVVVVSTVRTQRLDAIAGALGLVLVLVVWREMVVAPSADRFFSAARGGAIGIGALVAVGTAALLVGGGTPRMHLTDAAHMAVRQMFGSDVAWYASGGFTGAIGTLLPVCTAIVALVVLLVLLLPNGDVPDGDIDVRRRVTNLCASPDSDSLAPFTRRQDKSYVFSSDGRAVVGYRVVLGVCIAGPGPVGAADAHADAMAAFVQRCDERGWRPAMIGADDEARALGQVHGMHGIRIGDETIVSVAGFRLDQPSMRNVRQAVQRTRNSGVAVSVHRESELSPQLRADLAVVAKEWQHDDGELGFSMTLDHLLDNTYPDALLIVAAKDDHVVGFQRYIVCRGGRTLSLDVMPRQRRAPNGVNERLIVEAIHWAQANGADEVSLNFAAFRTLFEEAPSVGGRLMRGVVHLLDPFINVESLYRFNAKFHPSWTARHVLYRSMLDLPMLLVASLRVEFAHHHDTESVIATAGATAAMVWPDAGGHTLSS